MRALFARIRRLEGHLEQQAAGPNRVIEFDPLRTTADAALVGKPPGRYLLAPRFATDDEWRTALRMQQRKLIESAKRTTKPIPKESPQPFNGDTLAPGVTQRRALPVDERPEGGLKVVYKR